MARYVRNQLVLKRRHKLARVRDKLYIDKETGISKVTAAICVYREDYAVDC